jgi:hypothetical protein
MLNGFKKRCIEMFDELLSAEENQIRAQCNALNKSEGGYHEVVPGCDVSGLPSFTGPSQWRRAQSPSIVTWAAKHPEGPGLFVGLMVSISHSGTIVAASTHSLVDFVAFDDKSIECMYSLYII